MGKIFGISDNPVSTIDKAIKPLTYKKPVESVRILPKADNTTDKFISSEKPHTSNPFIKMRNGIGKLMAHFSKKQG